MRPASIRGLILVAAVVGLGLRCNRSSIDREKASPKEKVCPKTNFGKPSKCERRAEKSESRESSPAGTKHMDRNMPSTSSEMVGLDLSPRSNHSGKSARRRRLEGTGGNLETDEGVR